MQQLQPIPSQGPVFHNIIFMRPLKNHNSWREAASATSSVRPLEMNNHKPIQFLICVVGDGRKLTGRGAVRIWRTGSGCASVDSGPISARQLLEAYSYSRLANLRKSSVFTTKLMVTEIRTTLCCQSTHNAQNKIHQRRINLRYGDGIVLYLSSWITLFLIKRFKLRLFQVQFLHEPVRPCKLSLRLLKPFSCSAEDLPKNGGRRKSEETPEELIWVLCMYSIIAA